MIGMQELIHKLELGEWARHIKVGVGLGLVALLTVWYDLHEYKNFYAPEAMEAAQLARNLASGQGFTTQCIRPLSLHLVEQKQGPAAGLTRRPHPDLANPPLYPLVLAGLMKVLPFHYDVARPFWHYQPEDLIAYFNQGLFFLMAYLTFRLARKLFDLPVAVLALVLLLGADVLWRFSVSGLSTMLALLLLVGLLWGLCLLEQGARENTRSPAWFAGWGVATGVLVGLGGLTRYSFAWLIIPTLAFCVAYLGSRRALVAGLVAAGFLVVMAPWVARNYSLSGTWFGIPGFAMQQETDYFPETRLERSLDPDLSKVELWQYIRKLVKNTGSLVENELPKLGGSWFSAFFLVGLMLPFRSPALSRLRWFVVSAVVVLVGAQALGRTHLSTDAETINSENLLILLAPPVFMFGAGLFFVLLDQMSLPFIEARRGVVGIAAVLGCAPLAFNLLTRTYPLVYPPYMPPWIQESARLLQKHELMMSDMPWAVAWYGDRACVWTTLDAGRSFYAVNDNHKAIDALYLTPLTTDARFLTQLIQGQDWEWARFASEAILRTNLPPRFPLKEARSRYRPDQLLLCDRARWKDPPR